MIPVYGFVYGDTLGLVVLAAETDTMRSVAERLQASASVRVRPRSDIALLHEGRRVELDVTVASLGLKPLDRIDLVGIDADDPGDP